MTKGRLGSVAAVAVILLIAGGAALSSYYVAEKDPTLTFTSRPSPTSAESVTGCEFVASVNDLPVYAAPVGDVTQQDGTIAGDAGYAVLRQRGDYGVIELADGSRGWVDLHSGTLKGACSSVPVDTAPLSDYPSLCLFTNTTTLSLYNEPELSGDRGALPADTYVTIAQSKGSLLIYLNAASAAWVDASQGTISGSCDTLPFREPAAASPASAITISRVEIWSQPNAQTGQVLGTLSEDRIVTVVSGPINGPVVPGDDTTGDWYQITDSVSQLSGWVHADRLIVE